MRRPQEILSHVFSYSILFQDCSWKFNLQENKKLKNRNRKKNFSNCGWDNLPLFLHSTVKNKVYLKLFFLSSFFFKERKKKKCYKYEEVETVWYSVRIVFVHKEKKNEDGKQEKVKKFIHVNSLFFKFNSIANNSECWALYLNTNFVREKLFLILFEFVSLR